MSAAERPAIERVLTVDDRMVDDPYPVWAELRRSCPVYREPVANVVVVTTYDDLIDVARRPHDFSSILAAYGPQGADRGPVPAELCALARRAGGPDPVPTGRVRNLLDSYVPDLQDQLQHVDPPLHTRHRRLVSRWFTPPAVAEREPAVRAIVTALIDRFAIGGRVELVDALTGPLPATVIADLIGIPEDDRGLFLDWKEEVFGNPASTISRATSDRYVHIRELFLRFIADRRRRPRDDMISTLVAARTAGGEELDDNAVLGLLMLFLGGGQETTGKALGSAVRVLGDVPDLQAELRADSARIPAFVEEVLRYEPPVRGIFRLAVRDTAIGGVAVPEGSFVYLAWGSGNRDAGAFRAPDEFDPRRYERTGRAAAHAAEDPGDRPLLTFGHGIHLCPGAALARLQVRVALEELLGRFSSIQLADRAGIRYVRSYMLRGPAALWVELEP